VRDGLLELGLHLVPTQLKACSQIVGQLLIDNADLQFLLGHTTGVRPPLARRIPTELETAAGLVVDDFYW